MRKEDLYSAIERNEGLFTGLASAIWASPELSFRERKASAAQREALRSLGFRVAELDAVQENAFIAECGEGGPVVGLLGEFDALPGLSQRATATREAVSEGGPGHGCGHNLLGTACLAAAAAIKSGIESGALCGTVRYFGCPGEEMLGKAVLARAGVFKGLDAALCWHPADINSVGAYSTSAALQLEFAFKGKAAHAAQVPHMGRSALDALTLMSVGTEFLREHSTPGARIHYIVTSGGERPNIVPDFASGSFQVRAARMREARELVLRLIDVARGAALMTGTGMEYRLEQGCYDVIPNAVISDLIYENLKAAPRPSYDEEDMAFAAALTATNPAPQREAELEMLGVDPVSAERLAAVPLHREIGYFGKGWRMPSSTDVGDVSHIAPTGQMLAAAWPIGVGTHTWQATAASGSRLGMKGMLFAAKALAGTGWDLLRDEAARSRARKEFERAIGGEAYVPAEEIVAAQ